MKQVMCNVDLYGGDTKAGKWYDVTYDNGKMFLYYDDKDEVMACAHKESSHLDDHPNAHWSFREV